MASNLKLIFNIKKIHLLTQPTLLLHHLLCLLTKFVVFIAIIVEQI